MGIAPTEDQHLCTAHTRSDPLDDPLDGPLEELRLGLTPWMEELRLGLTPWTGHEVTERHGYIPHIRPIGDDHRGSAGQVDESPVAGS